MPTTRTPSRRRLPARTAAMLIALAALLAPTAAWADDPPTTDPGLTQTIDADEPIVHGDKVISTGHVDMGPRFDGSTWRFLVHDDAARANKDARSVWRHPAETVLQVVDDAELKVPEGETYAFLGAKAGATVWVVPQTQDPDVVWTGWNTQDPTVMSKIDRGVTFAVDGVQGPGTLTVYLQSGDFGAPQVLWDSRRSGSQPVFVESNTHTHANWVFTEPGVYLVRMTTSATLRDGSSASDTQLVRFAVGSGTSTDEALRADWTGAAAATGAQPSTGAETTPVPVARPGDGGGGGASTVLLLGVAIGVVALALVVVFTTLVLRGNQAKKRALSTRAARGTGEGSGT